MSGMSFALATSTSTSNSKETSKPINKKNTGVCLVGKTIVRVVAIFQNIKYKNIYKFYVMKKKLSKELCIIIKRTKTYAKLK